MRNFCESLEVRTLLSHGGGGVGAVTLDYDTVVADAGALKADLKTVLFVYKADSKVIAADIKALGKNKTNSTDISKLNKAVSGATSPDSKITNKLISAGKTALSHAQSAYIADIKRPTAANAAKLIKAIAGLTNALTPYEGTLATDTATGDANVDAALAVLVAANPTDSKLSNDVSNAEDNSSTALTTLTDQVTTTNSDISALATAAS